MANLLGFTPYVGQSQKLNSVLKKDGQFLITVDDGKIYVDINDKRHLVGEAKNQNDFIYGVFLATKWEYNQKTGIYSQTIENDKISGDFPLIIDLVVSSNNDVGIIEEDDWAKITKIVSDKKAATAYCYEDCPTVDLNFQAKEV